MRKLFLKYCKPYRWLICRLFGKYDVEQISIPFAIFGDFKYCYLGYDEKGVVQKAFTNIIDALRHKGNLGLTVIYDKY